MEDGQTVQGLIRIVGTVHVSCHILDSFDSSHSPGTNCKMTSGVPLANIISSINCEKKKNLLTSRREFLLRFGVVVLAYHVVLLVAFLVLLQLSGKRMNHHQRHNIIYLFFSFSCSDKRRRNQYHDLSLQNS